ncbi:probable serine/threonine-protein kinase fhkB [Hibiscus syriacus]|uniref:probable serine/threonine-protein kinase fhkB n=1 Tax=Hibiscus syriacus TaxID=106335 RepID=UPI001920ED8A|nr:probable serine/threonine-protein kinase fhkB [Hibiscus syriacus]
MVGGGSRWDEGSVVITSTNVFAALETLRKKKKSDKDRRSRKSSSKSQQQKSQQEPESQVFWTPAPLTVKSWADVDDEDDDDFYAMTALPQSVWGTSEPSQNHEEKTASVEDSESEEDILDEGDDDMNEDHDEEPEIQVHPEPMLKRDLEIPAPPKEAERQLSKKERKRKELAELDALLADFGATQRESYSQDESHGNFNQLDVPQEKKENPPGESKSTKKKKKKDKSKEGKEIQDQPSSTDATNGPDAAAWNEQTGENAAAVDVKERLKKVTSMKKKKSSKEMDAAAKAAAQEAAARSAKKKEKSRYNQQPVR